MKATSLTSAIVLAAGLAAPAGADCPGCGTVTGSISVEMASVRPDGPKHDRDVVVMLEPVGAAAPPAASGHAAMDQTGLVFVPHVLAVERGTTVTFLNNDQEQHNVYFLDDRTGDTLDIGTWGPGVSVEHTFDRPGVMITLCKLHLEMAAYVVVCPSPWFHSVQLDPATSTASYEIADVPAGRYELAVWHKKLKQQGGAVRIVVTPAAATEVDIVITKAKFARAAD
ncbi:MAG TPA: plastocyanin/azurin family copper-binding protein [Methylomirabilota bacterium]|nr:plastocyanin/azurin family copper-binding protein [Methylomirabilota bacterium]